MPGALFYILPRLTGKEPAAVGRNPRPGARVGSPGSPRSRRTLPTPSYLEDEEECIAKCLSLVSLYSDAQFSVKSAGSIRSVPSKHYSSELPNRGQQSSSSALRQVSSMKRKSSKRVAICEGKNTMALEVNGVCFEYSDLSEV
mmetsp:Transcript_48847/g.116132  ORF Transcript_48847/g.116132 Transcript_48847/m.116132 type:complete len:143 (-) Transcript_48847:76-504(-)|eukprot:CAMPEP_0178438410 /NCGR_PEP_ID=MMETSP0689_2-20121128/35578_1 /TAXON_ID=160604 /ORGANISM="Amphidinium massartii, Strain CS-259" /LENGTH=142 /DNA_ID=CAMNT_0020060811 /DNA_START=44 /DNA_END=472 /DNA_ORIENTATION=+